MFVRIDGGAGYGCFGEGFAMNAEGLCNYSAVLSF